MRVGLRVSLDFALDSIPGKWSKPGHIIYLPLLSIFLLNMGRLF